MKRVFGDENRWLIYKSKTIGKWYVLPPTSLEECGLARGGVFPTGREALTEFAARSAE
ncbi:hypothetical protein SEA_BOILGATE_57 [Mycobacterium phage Boilgate]|nr:hypothetical protein SEA_BOILGATE_57 [Mycobacterium phage Boilgate]